MCLYLEFCNICCARFCATAPRTMAEGGSEEDLSLSADLLELSSLTSVKSIAGIAIPAVILNGE